MFGNFFSSFVDMIESRISFALLEFENAAKKGDFLGTAGVRMEISREKWVRPISNRSLYS